MALCAYRLRFAFFVLIAMFFISAIAQPVDWRDRPVPTWLTPLQLRRSEVFAACGALIAFAGIVHVGRMRGFRRSPQGWMLLLIALYAGVIRVIGGSPLEGILSIVFGLVTVLNLVLVLPALLAEEEDWFRLVRSLAFVTVIWVGAVAVQFVIHRRPLTLGGNLGSRFNGMINNAQAAGIFLATGIVLCLFLVLEDSKARFKPLWITMTGMNFALLLWTGSRTSLAMCVIGCSAILYTRIGRAILWLPAVAVLGAVALRIVQGSGAEMDLARFTEGGNTRSAVWLALLKVAIENPILGVSGVTSETNSENSWLYGAAQYGVGMFALILLFTGISAQQMLQLFRVKRVLGATGKRFADLVIGYNAMFFAGAIFEGYIIARVSALIVVMLSTSAMTARLLQEADAADFADDLPGNDSNSDEPGSWNYSDAPEHG